MSNIKLILTENKATPYRKQRVVGRLGDGGLTTIDVELVQADGKTPYSIFSNQELVFVGTNSKGEYTDGIPEIIDGQRGIIKYTFTKENFSVIHEFKRAYFQLTDADGSQVTFQDFSVDVLKNSDIDQGQVTLYVRLLDQLLDDFEKRFGIQSVDFEERFKVFLQAKESQYQNIYQMYNDLVIKLDKLSKDTKSLEQMQAEILKSIEEHDVFTKEESSANVIYQLIGKEKAQIKLILDLKGKVVGSMLENPHMAKGGNFADIVPPEQSGWGEVLQTSYDQMSELDGTAYRSATNGSGLRKEVLISWDVLAAVKTYFKDAFFADQGITNDSQIVAFIRKSIVKLEGNIWGFGSNPTGNKLTMSTRRINHNDPIWAYGASNTSNSISKISSSISNTSAFAYISNEGKVFNNAYAEPSDGLTYSIINIDHANLEITLELSMNEYILSTIAANHVENLATQEEAEEASNNSKTMTPLRVFQAITKWTKDKFVSKTENETVLGSKNFQDGLQVGGRNVLSQNGLQTYDHTSATDSAIQSGMIRFIRFGDFILVNFNFQCRSTNIASGGNIIGVLESDILPTNSIQIDITGDKAVTVETSGKLTALWGLNANSYYAGSAVYFAKNKL